MTGAGEFAFRPPVIDGCQVLAMSALARTVPLADHVLDYAAEVGSAPPNPTGAARGAFELGGPCVQPFGASPRAVQALALTGKVRALLAGRFNVAFDDIRASAPGLVLACAIASCSVSRAEADGLTSDRLIRAGFPRIGAGNSPTRSSPDDRQSGA